eukprot:CAMPEP_0168328386 /NCGR_PEP_ID=MMETSP0213-20121227/6461_1 /TAXON_ID=151035 /ORGANISM="Euplotes harpa, Strain FSP1.4" /LENGTH=92 /DNA_ID=CAMNT_0008331469 /DNA_START=741 /DNA_END=1019 /DNA_ORIENTATION=-
MVDSEICVRTFNVTKDVPIRSRMANPAINPSNAERAAHDEVSGDLNLGLQTPSSTNMTPQHTGRLSSIHNMTYLPSMGVGDHENFSDDSDVI